MREGPVAVFYERVLSRRTVRLTVLLLLSAIIGLAQPLPVEADAVPATQEIRQHIRDGQLEDADERIRALRARDTGPVVEQLSARLALARRRFGKALTHLERARDLGDRTSEWHVLRGRLYLKQLRPGKALDQFERVEPGPRVNVYRAEAHVQRGNFRRARALLPEQTEEVRDLVDTIVRLRQAIRAGTDFQFSSDWSGRYRPDRRTKKERRHYGITVTSRRGYNDNVATQSELSIRETDISESKDHFNRHAVRGWVRPYRGRRQALVLFGNVSNKDYDQQTDFDVLSYRGGVQFTRLLSEERWVDVGGSYRKVDVGESDYSSDGGGFFRYHIRPHDGLEWTLSYRYTVYDYDDDPPEDEDRDGPVHRVTFRPTVTTQFLGDTVVWEPFVLAGKANTDGNDMEHEFVGGGATLNVWLMESLRWSSYGKYRFRDHVNNRVVGGIVFGKREDDQRVYQSSLHYELNSHVTLNARWTHRNNNSNVPIFTYEQTEVSVGLSLSRF